MKIIEAYKDYQPPVMVAETIQTLLAYVPQDYLIGISEVAVTNCSGLSKKVKQQKTARGYRVSEVRGLYRDASSSQPARIEIYIDNAFEGWPPLFWRWPMVRNMIVGEVLYHEIGHHLVSRRGAQRIEKQEASATHEQGILMRQFFRQRYWYLAPLLALPLRCLTAIRRGRAKG